jgi:hypothetical protein
MKRQALWRLASGLAAVGLYAVRGDGVSRLADPADGGGVASTP